MSIATLAQPHAALKGISSMATRALLGDAASTHALATGQAVEVESVGGVDAARRVQAGEPFDAVMLASDAIERLMREGHLQSGSRVDFVRSAVAVAVPAHAPTPDISSAAALRKAVAAAASIGYSTGPSGTALLAMIERWGLMDAVKARLVQAPAGVPVAQLVASGEVALGFQQRSELLGQAGITLVGDLPSDAAIVTVFSGAIGVHASQPEAARRWLRFLASADTAGLKLQHGMSAA